MNTASGPGHGPWLAGEIARPCAEVGTSATVVTVAGAAGIASEARDALGHGHMVVAGGGDGTVNAVASALAATGGTLGVLPLGTCNHFAKALGLPLDLRGAVRTALTGRERAVDVGEVNGQVFLNNSSLGVYPQLVRGRKAEQKQGHCKWVALAMAAVACLRHPPPLLVLRLRVNGDEALVRRTPLLFVGNNRYGTSTLHMGGRGRLDGGQFWVCVTHEAGYAQLPGLAVRALAGHLRPQDMETRDTAEFWVETQRCRVEVAWDGEVSTMASPLHYRIRPGALRVMAPGCGTGSTAAI